MPGFNTPYRSWRPKVGDVILVASDLSDVNSIKEYTVSKVGQSTCQCGSSEMTFYIAQCWPVSYKSDLVKIVAERQRLKEAYDDSMKLVYQLKNKLSVEYNREKEK